MTTVKCIETDSTEGESVSVSESRSSVEIDISNCAKIEVEFSGVGRITQFRYCRDLPPSAMPSTMPSAMPSAPTTSPSASPSSLTSTLCQQVLYSCDTVNFSFDPDKDKKDVECATDGVQVCAASVCKEEGKGDFFESACVSQQDLEDLFDSTPEEELPFTCGCCSPLVRSGSRKTRSKPYPDFCATATICRNGETRESCSLDAADDQRCKSQAKDSKNTRQLQKQDRKSTMVRGERTRQTTQVSQLVVANGQGDGVIVCMDGQEYCLDPLEPMDILVSESQAATCGPCATVG